MEQNYEFPIIEKNDMGLELTEHVTFLYYLNVAYDFDLELLFLLYAHLKMWLFFIFFLFAGKKFSFPNHTRLYKIFSDSRAICNDIKTGNVSVFDNERLFKVKEKILSHYDSSTNEVTIQVETEVRK